MTILTTNEYWDCECYRDYIHPNVVMIEFRQAYE
jgi:hypothetical protein